MRALYGLKSSGAAWRAHLAESMSDIGYDPCEADPDVWMKSNTDGKGRDYYEYVLIYVDDVLAISHEPNVIMNALTKLYRLKEPPEAPARYLGANMGKYEFADGGKAWYQSSDDYIKAAVKNVDKQL